MNTEYVLTGTFEELKKIINKVFIEPAKCDSEYKELQGDDKEINEYLTKLITELLLSCEDKAIGQGCVDNEICNSSDEDSSEYKARVFSTRYTISLSNFLFDFIKLVILEYYRFCNSKGENNTFSVEMCYPMFGFFKIVISNLRRIKDDECCIYYNILRILKDNKRQYFTEDEVNPQKGFDCPHIEKKFFCKKRDSNNKCSAEDSFTKDVLNKLCNENVLKYDKGKYSFRF